jgi:hypothetical protein
VLFTFTERISAQGPQSPEASSFEPVDASDMVNLFTGDMSYVIPFLSIPGPDGGYPLSLSYHAGIAMEQEASWVGLGWTLNPGAINRSVNGYPDDWNNRKKTSIMYDIGGTYTTHDVSATFGWKDSKFSVGLYASFGVNKAFGGETTYNTGYGGSLAVGRSKLTVNNTGIGLSYQTFLGEAFVNITRSNGFSYGLGKSIAGLGISLHSNGNKYITTNNGNLQVSGSGGFSSKLSTKTIGTVISANINIGAFSLGYSRKKQRYTWYDRASYDCLGILYAGQTDEMMSNSLHPANASVDAYQAIYKTADNQQLLENNFTGPSYDSYTLSSQGLSGSITPYLFEHGSFKNRYNRVSSTNDNKNATQSTFSYYDNSFSKQVDNPNNDVNFYFENINASYMSLSSGLWPSFSSVNSITDINVNNQETSHTTSVNGTNQTNYNSTNNRINNGPFIEVFTNGEIVSNPDIIIESAGMDHTNKPSDGIGAYRITNADGLVYHYSLPVYQKEMFSRTAKIDENIDNKFYEDQQFTPYATHWLLTAITGPDYIKNDNTRNYPDEGDYGYWIRFDYGKWSDGYGWRTPVENLTYHENDRSKSFGWGVKEIYYLDMIKTRTHTALFVKEDRKDNYGAEINIGSSLSSPVVYNYNSKNVLGYSGSTYFVKGIYDNHAVNLSTGVYLSDILHKEYVNIDKHKSLRLKEIYLLKNKDVPNNLKTYASENNGKKIGEMYFEEEVSVYSITSALVYHANYPLLPYAGGLKEWNGEFYQNVLNSSDITNNISNINDLKVNHIKMIYDNAYPLIKNSPNSIHSNKGKLTLSEVSFLGRADEPLIPPYQFTYNSSSNYSRDYEDSWGYTAGYPKSASLKNIKTPLGSDLKITYESDDFYQEAATNYRTYNDGIQFNFYHYNGMLRFDIENKVGSENLNYFNDFFEIGVPVKVDIWAALKHEYNNGGCKDRYGSIDIPNEFVNVVYVSSSKVTFETTLDFTYNEDDGLGWLYNAGPMGLGFSDHTMQNLLRGQFPDMPGGCSQDTAVVFLFKIFAEDSRKNLKEGGLRVKSIAIEDASTSYKTNYYYNDLNYEKDPYNNNYRSSGITSYSPSKYDKEVEYITELPAPGVTYEFVTVETLGSDNAVNSKTVYNFETFKPIVKTVNSTYSPGILYIDKTVDENSNVYTVNNSSSKISSSKYVVKDNKSALGRLLSLSHYNTNEQLLSQTTNLYRDFDENNQGVVQETFYTYTKKVIAGSTDEYQLNSSSKIVNSNSLLSSETIENTTNISLYSKYDFNTGQLLETINEDSEGNRFKTEVIRAYTIAEYNPLAGYGMGSKVDNITNKNMLSQQAMGKSYVEVDGEWQETGVGITTWNNQWIYPTQSVTPETITNPLQKIWRKHKSFIWDGETNVDGTYDDFVGDDDNFNWTVGSIGNNPFGQPVLNETVQTNPKWKNIATTTKYDHYSMPLEFRDINNNYSITKMTDNNTKIGLSVNSQYYESCYTGAEYYVSGENRLDAQVRGSSGLRTTAFAHTGDYSLALTPIGNDFGGVLKGRQHKVGKYKMSVWVHKNNYQNAKIKVGYSGTLTDFNGEVNIAGDWVLMNHYYNRTDNSGDIILMVACASGTIYVDDFRIHPVESTMTSYVYNEWDELVSILSSNNLATKFEYDSQGRLIKTYQEVIDSPSATGGFKLIKENDYNYRLQQ